MIEKQNESREIREHVFSIVYQFAYHTDIELDNLVLNYFNSKSEEYTELSDEMFQYDYKNYIASKYKADLPVVKAIEKFLLLKSLSNNDELKFDLHSAIKQQFAKTERENREIFFSDLNRIFCNYFEVDRENFDVRLEVKNYVDYGEKDTMFEKEVKYAFSTYYKSIGYDFNIRARFNFATAFETLFKQIDSLDSLNENDLVELNKIVDNCQKLSKIYKKNIYSIAIATLENLDSIDEYIKKYAKGWSFKRLDKEVIAIFRIAICELIFIKKQPNIVIVNEAVILAKKFCHDDAYKFVNGTLAQILKDME